MTIRAYKKAIEARPGKMCKGLHGIPREHTCLISWDLAMLLEAKLGHTFLGLCVAKFWCTLLVS